MVKKNAKCVQFLGGENLKYLLIFAPFMMTFKNLDIWFRYLNSTFIFMRTQLLNSYQDQTGHANCLSTSLPLLGSLATWFPSTVAPRHQNYSKWLCKMQPLPSPHGIRIITHVSVVLNMRFLTMMLLTKKILSTTKKCLLISGELPKVVSLLIFTTIQWGGCYSSINPTNTY